MTQLDMVRHSLSSLLEYIEKEAEKAATESDSEFIDGYYRGEMTALRTALYAIDLQRDKTADGCPPSTAPIVPSEAPATSVA